MEPIIPHELTDLLAQASWARELALHLVRDPDQADDLVQETWRRALERPPRRSQSANSADGPRGWLATVMRNLASNWRRDRRLRDWHETQASRPEAFSTDETERRVELQRRLAVAVLELSEPYRSAIRLRYFDGLEPREVARRQGISYDAARQRLSRGLALLRARLDPKSGGERAAWCALLIECARGGRPTVARPSVPWKGVLMSMQAKVITSAAVVLALLSVLFWSSTRKTAADSEAERVAHGTSLSSPSDGERVPPSSSDSELLSSSSTRSAQVAPTASTHKIDRDHDLHGIVLDSASQPVVGARVEIRQSESDGYTFPDQVRDGAPTRTETKTAETVTDAEGRFAVALPIGRPHSLEVSAAGFALERMDDRFAGEFVRVCLRHGASLLGRVTRTDDGAPVAGVEIEIAAAGRNPPRLPKIVLVTDALGGYRVDGLAPIRRFVHLVPTVEVPVKMQSRMLELTEGEMRKVDFSVELSRTVPLRGYVLDASTKAPIAGAQVLAFFSVIETDETGRYAFQGAAREDARGVSARAVGYEMQHKSFSPSRDVEFPERVDFELRPTRTARGRVLDVEGKPVPDAYVAVVTLPPADETGHAEGYWSRKSPRVSEAAWHFAHSAGDGSFEVAGVSPDANCSLDVREATCALIARKPGFGTQTYFFPPRATDTPRIELGDVVMHPMSVVRGTVVDDRGQGVRDRTVCFSRVTQIGPETCTPHEATFAEFEWQRTARSDDLGRFSFADVSSGTYCFPLALNTGTTPVGMAQAVEVEEGATVDGLRLVVPGSLTIEGRVVDASGHAIPNAWLFAQPLLPSVDAGVPPRLGFESEHAETDAHGRFKISFLAAGEHRISVYPSLLNTLSEQRITFPPKQLSGIQAGTRDLEIRLDPTSWIRGRVVAPGGAGAPQYWVTATIRGDGHVTGGMTDGDGRFQFAIAPDEIVDLVARRQWSPDLEPSELARSAKLEGVSAGETDVILQLH